MFRGPNAIAGHFIRALDDFLQTLGVDRIFNVTTATLQYDRGKYPGRVVQGPSAKGASLQEAKERSKKRGNREAEPSARPRITLNLLDHI